MQNKNSIIWFSTTRIEFVSRSALNWINREKNTQLREHSCNDIMTIRDGYIIYFLNVYLHSLLSHGKKNFILLKMDFQ